MVNAILAKRVNHIVAKGDHPAWPKGSKSRGFSKLLTIGTINRDEYAGFAMEHFTNHNLELPREVFDEIYDKFDDHTWYI